MFKSYVILHDMLDLTIHLPQYWIRVLCVKIDDILLGIVFSNDAFRLLDVTRNCWLTLEWDEMFTRNIISLSKFKLEE